MRTLSSPHYFELAASGISDEIAAKYFYSIEGQDAQDWLIEDAQDNLGAHSQQYVTAPLGRLLEQSEHVKAGGWVCSANGQIKPNEPRNAIELVGGEYLPVLNKDGSNRKVKYEIKREVGGYRGANVSLMQPIGEAIKVSGQRLIVITEGSKKAAAAATLGYEAIGLPGVTMGEFKEGLAAPQLIPVLKALAEEGCIFAIAFDADKKKATQKNVALATFKLAQSLSAYGSIVTVPNWNHRAGKGFDDVLVAKGAGFVHQLIGQAPTVEEWKESKPKSWFIRSKAATASYKAELARIEKMHAAFLAKPVATTTINQRYIGKVDMPAQGSAVFFASPMNTGKTHSMIELVAEHRKEYPDAAIISSAYRNILLRQSGLALGITHWSDADEPSLAKFGALAACPESLPKLASQKIPAHSLLIIDEIVAWLRHIFCSDTMRNGADRVAVLNAVRTILSKVVDGGGFIIGLEANIPQWAVDCFKALLPQGAPLSLLRNEYKMQSNQKAFFHSKLNAFKAEQQLMVLKGVRICVASDSATQIDDQYRQMFKGAKDFHISAMNSSEPQAQSFAEDPNGWLMRRGCLRVFGYSPTIGAGVSIDGDWFDAVTGVFSHLPSYDAAQQLKRYRKDVPLHLFCQEKGVGIGGADLSIFNPEKLLARWRETTAYGHTLVNAAEYLSQDNDSSLISVLRRSLDGEIEDIAMIDKWRSIATAIDNFDKLHLKENLKKNLVEQGYEIVDVSDEFTPGKSEEFAALRDQANDEAGEEFAAVVVPETMTPDEARTIMSSHGHSRQESLQARKALYVFEFPNCDFNDAKFCTDWLMKNKGKKLAQLRVEWAARNPDSAKSIDRWHLKSKLKQAHNLHSGVSAADIKQLSPAADLFAKAQLPQAIDTIGNEHYNNEHPEVVRVGEWIRDNEDALKKVFRMRFDDDRSNLDVFNSFARKLGYAPKAEKQKRNGNKCEKQYTLTDFANPDRGHMLKSLSDKFASKLEQKGETLKGETLAPASDWGVDLEALEQRKTVAQPVPVGDVALTPGKDIFWQELEQQLINAKSADAIEKAFAGASENLVLQLTETWAGDGRYEWLLNKIDALEAV